MLQIYRWTIEYFVAHINTYIFLNAPLTQKINLEALYTPADMNKETYKLTHTHTHKCAHKTT